MEQLKLAIKNKVKGDWKNIIWLVDKDSEMLSIDLYSSIYRTENLVRKFINEIMTKEYGISWWDDYVPMKIKNKHRDRISGYKAVAPGFDNVDERLMSIDIRDLISIFTLTEREWKPTFSVEINDFLNGYSNLKIEKIKEILSGQMVIKKEIWVTQFSQYLSDDFVKKLKDFEFNRNHVAHNKLIDRAAYTTIRDSIFKVVSELENAIKKASVNIISEEKRQQIDEIMEMKNIEAQEHFYEIIESETGVEIRDQDEIISLFNEHLFEFHSVVQTQLRFRNDIEIGEYQHISFSNEAGTLFEMVYKIKNIIAYFDYEILEINDSPGEESAINVSIKIDNVHYEKKIRYVNGEALYDDDQGCYMPETKDEFNLTDIEELLEEFHNFIDTYFENMRKKVDLDMYSIIKDGGNSPVAEGVLCHECGEEYICISESYGEYGICLNCGEINKIDECERCGCIFQLEDLNTDDDYPLLCENCLEHYKNE